MENDRQKLHNHENSYPQYFMRIFQFQKTKNWTLPTELYTASKFMIPELQDMKQQLNYVKSQLSQFDLKEWSMHTQNRDIAGYIMQQLRKKIRPELLTQAWCKFYEIISTFPLVPLDNPNFFRSLHLCEAPGAFICALNHYLVINHPDIHWEWSANTLNPEYEGNPLSQMIADDRLLCHTRNHWQFGEDLTGDIQKYYNHCNIVRNNNKEKVMLVTADGSIDCMGNPGEQERLVEFLHYCETITAVCVLKKGGSFILKIFTIFEESTICLLFLLNCIFEKVSVFKPCTSKSGNSELYIICNVFYGFDTNGPIWEALIKPYRDGYFDKNTSMFSLDDIPYCFKIQLLSCCSDFFIEKQISVIKDNIYYFLNPNQTESAVLNHLKIGIANHYIYKSRLRPIPKHRKIVPYINVHERKRKFDDTDSFRYITKNAINFDTNSIDTFLKIVYGKRIDIVNSSKFATKESLDNLIRKFEIKKDPGIGMLYSLALKCVTTTSTVINVKNYILNPYYRFQNDVFASISLAINDNKHIIFVNIPFSTHFMAGLWCILASGFSEVHFGFGWTVFYKPLKSSIQSVKKVFDQIEASFNNINHDSFPADILHLVSPEIFDGSFSFLSYILHTNNQFCIPD